MRTRSARVMFVVSLAGMFVAGLIAQSPQRPGVFRAGVTLVPVDVRVIDRDGKPVTGLTAADFTVLENGVPQEIRQFTSHTVTPSAAENGVPLRRLSSFPDALTPQNRRLFLIVLGRGRLQEPSKGLDALLRFVRERLLPQDQVALMAWNRATDFTTDHARIAGVIARFRAKHEEIETFMRESFSGLAGLYGSRHIPAFIQTKIDEVFSDPLTPGTRAVVPTGATQAAEDLAKRQTDDILNRSTLEAFRQFGGTDSRLADMMSDATFGMDFDEYISLSRQTMQDVGNLYAGIDYLRFIDGEKHLIFVTENGFLLPSADFDREIAALASDARVAIDAIQTGGVVTTLVDNVPVVTPQTGFALRALRTVAEGSGGQVSTSTRADVAIDHILAATGFGYLIGYSPSNTTLDGRFRTLKIEVKRRGVTVLYRRGYFARAEAETFDPRRSLASTRIITASNYSGDIKDLDVSFKVTDTKSGSLRGVKVDAVVNASRIVFARMAGVNGVQHLAALNVAVFCTDREGVSVGEQWKSVDLTVPDTMLPAVRQAGLAFSVDVPVRQPPIFVKVVVYDYGSDLIGTKYTRMH